MKFTRELAERFFDLVRAGGARHAKALVVIFVLNRHRLAKNLPVGKVCQKKQLKICRCRTEFDHLTFSSCCPRSSKGVPPMSPFAPPNLKEYLVTFDLATKFDSRIGVRHGLAVDLHDDVAFLEAGLGRVGIRIQIRDDGTLHIVRNLQFLPRITIQICHGHTVKPIGLGIVRIGAAQFIGAGNILAGQFGQGNRDVFLNSVAGLTLPWRNCPVSHWETASVRPCASTTSLSLNATMTSPALIPAFSAGVLGNTSPPTHRCRR